MIAEAGGRWDRYSYPDSLEFDVFSPRANLVYAIGARDDLRFAWSVVHQPQGIDQLQIEDDDTNFFRPERSQQLVLGFTHRFEYGLSARVDIYNKDYTHLRPRFENALDSMQLIPEGAVDRVRIDAPEANARGVELTLRREATQGLAGWVSLAFAEARDKEASGWVPRTWDQERSLSFGASWTGTSWNITVAGLYHSGTPTTPLELDSALAPGGGEVLVVSAGPRNSENLGSYSRLDLRANRDVQLQNSKLTFYFEVTNLLNTENPCCIENIDVLGGVSGPRLFLEESNWLPMLPSFGFQWEF